MGRKKKNDSGKLAALAREYYEKEAFGNPKKLKCSNFAKYAREHGCNAQAYDFRRDREVRAFMDEVLGAPGNAVEYLNTELGKKRNQSYRKRSKKYLTDLYKGKAS